MGYITGEPGQAEIGYWIGKPWWGRGYATEAAGTLVRHCFADVGFRQLTCGHFVDNPASERVIKKFGFRRVGTGAQWCEARKSEVPTVDMCAGDHCSPAGGGRRDEVSRPGQDLHQVRRRR